MNFLAHAFLSMNREHLVLGNFLADFLRGKEIGAMDPSIQKGIQLHRFIDEFTDHHPTVEELIQHFRDPFKKYSGVVVDVWFDFFLAHYWQEWTSQEFESFKLNFYHLIKTNNHLLNERAKGFTHYMLTTDAFESYRSQEGISRVLSQMSKRTKFNSQMELGGLELEKNYDKIRLSFNAFFPELIKACDQFIKDEVDDAA